MDVYKFVKDHQHPTVDGIMAEVRSLYDRYVEHTKGAGYVPVPVEQFVFSSCTRYAWPVGTVVRVKDGTGRPRVVKGYAECVDEVTLTGGLSVPAWNLEPADIPEDVLEIARQQVEAKMADKCPLKEPSCLS